MGKLASLVIITPMGKAKVTILAEEISEKLDPKLVTHEPIYLLRLFQRGTKFVLIVWSAITFPNE
jgi:hypothetical protein